MVRNIALVLGVIGLLFTLGPTVFGADWPNCIPESCTSQNLQVMGARAVITGSCSSLPRTADIQIEFDRLGVNYNVRISGEVLDSSDTSVAVIDMCVGTVPADGWYTILSGVTWDCDKSLSVVELFVSWQINVANFACLSTLPCASVNPMCDKTYYSTPLEVEGTEPLNTPPTGSDSSVIATEDVVYTLALSDFGYSDADSDPLAQIQITSLETVGNLKISGTDVTLNQVVTAAQLNAGDLTYTPLPTESGAPYDTFRFKVHDGTEYSASDYQMTVNVTAVNDPPTAMDDETSTPEHTPILVDVVANDTDPEGGALQVVSVTTPSHGSAVIAGNMVQYTPALFFHGDDQFEYTVRDAGGAQASASVFVHVIPMNEPPIANAGIIYQGMTGEEILFDARFSSDPDVMDILEYRWDLNGDGEWETEWLTSATFEYVYAFPYRGLVTVQVRDRHLGVLNGTTSEDSAFALIQPKPTQIAVSVYVDLNGNGEFDEGDVGLPGVSLLLDGEVELYTGQDGTALADDVAPGGHIIRISEAGIAYLQERGFFLPEEALASVELQSGDWVALFFNPEARGFLEIDLGAEE
ncbi:Ig-like domain-containing protein [Candidatus Bipolaricaulota bacterium]